MPKIFRKKGARGAGAGDDDDEQDEMTITSGWSIGNSSVSDRIMGRMKKNLSFPNRGGGGQQNFGSSSSVASRRSTGMFGGRRTTGYQSDSNDMLCSGHSVDGGGGGGKRSRSSSARRFRSAAGSGTSGVTSSVGVDAMEEMDSSEAMALRGQTMGRRSRPGLEGGSPSSRRFSRRSLTAQQRSQRSLRGLGLGGADHVHEPVEYSLAQLRSMDEDELEKVMRRAGVPGNDIADKLNQGLPSEASNDTGAEDQRKNLLVALFVNSGHVKLVANDTNDTATDRRSMVSSLSMSGVTSRDLLVAEPTRVSPPTSENARVSLPSSEAITDVASSVGSKDKKTSKKSKLEKIAELKTESSNMKRENRSLKKTVKKLLGQLTTAIEEKDELQRAIDVGGKERQLGKEASLDDVELSKNSLHSIDETDGADKGEDDKRTPQDANDNEDHTKMPQDAKDDNPIDASNQIRPPRDVVAHGEKDDESTSVQSESRASAMTSSVSKKDVVYLKRKLKKEKQAHEDTEFRLKAELEILTNEVDGLQRELGLTLESLDDAKKRSRELRSSASSLKHQLRSASIKAKELAAEAEARDKLIETFTKILLQRVGGAEGEDGGQGGGMPGMLVCQDLQGLVLEEKTGEEIPIDEVEESYAALKVL